jgi:hypothetical protein
LIGRWGRVIEIAFAMFKGALKMAKYLSARRLKDGARLVSRNTDLWAKSGFRLCICLLLYHKLTSVRYTLAHKLPQDWQYF